MAAAKHKISLCRSFFGRIHNRYNSQAVEFCYLREEANHCSGLKPHIQFNSESRGLVIQQSIDHLKTQKSIKIKDQVKQILVNDQYKSKGLDEKRFV